MKRRARSHLLGLAAALAVAAGPAAGATRDASHDLEAVRRAIGESRERVAVFEREERGLLAAVEALDRASVALSREVRRARVVASTARAALRELEEQVEGASERLERTRSAMALRAVALYKAGDVGPVRVLFADGDLRDMLARVRALRLLLRHDNELAARFQAETEVLADARARARAAAAQRDAAVERLAERSAGLSGEREAKRIVIAELAGDRARARAALGELETAARALEEALATLRETPGPRWGAREGGRFGGLRGKLEPPVSASIARDFGRVVDAQFRTETFRKGIDFDAPFGEPVRAVADGEVRYAGWFRGYGKVVILDHGDQYFTVSGHLDAIDVQLGDWVPAGELVGRSGDTGSLSGPLLYFEIRRGGEPLDPRRWLKGLDPS